MHKKNCSKNVAMLLQKYHVWTPLYININAQKMFLILIKLWLFVSREQPISTYYMYAEQKENKLENIDKKN